MLTAVFAWPMIDAQINARSLLRSVTQSHFYEHLFTHFRWEKLLERLRTAVIDRFRRDVTPGVFWFQGWEHLH